MYSTSTEKAPPPDAGKYVPWAVVGILVIIIFIITGNQSITLWMNFGEFGDEFTKPLYYSVISALVLSVIALVRVNFVSRSSIFWYSISTAISFINRGPRDPIAKNINGFRDYKMGLASSRYGRSQRYSSLAPSSQT